MNSVKIMPPECAEKQDKHASLDAEINSLSALREHADSIVRKITGNYPDENAAVKGQDYSLPPLMVLLDAGPDRISSVVGSIHSLLSEIEQALFG